MATSFPAAPPGTFAPGTKVQVGGHRVIIQKYLSEGGFAHVYVVNYPSPSGKHTETAVLKRVAVPDKEALANMRTEVETMKKLKGHKHIVTYIDSHASQLKNGGYEVFLLMEWCQGGGLIDFMNTRLKNRLTEPEILQIFGDTAEGLACMHYLRPPLLHRDLKIENILISKDGDERLYKLCDFGSSAPPRPAATSAAEGKLIEDDVQRHTTMQYRSPEMIDVYRNRPIDEKSDIWALGVMLYKLCYYTTPFEEKGQMAILTASYKYPAYPVFSDKLKLFIAKMLTEEPRKRPNIYQVLSEVCGMRGKPIPIKDIYATRTASEARSTQQLPSRDLHVKSPPVLGASIVPPEKETPKIPDIAPMRRGRPTSTTNATNAPSGKAVSKDPFAALDSSNYNVRAQAADELAGKYPALEDFALLQDSASSKFKFDTTASKAPLNTRVTNTLADEAFSSLRTKPLSETVATPPVKPPRPQPTQHGKQPFHSSDSAERPPERPVVNSSSFTTPPSVMVSTGTSTDDLPPPPKPPRPLAKPEIKEKPIWRVPAMSKSPQLSALTKSENPGLGGSSLRDLSRSPSYQDELPQSPSSSRPSLEGVRPSSLIVRDIPPRSHSTSSRPEHKRSRSQQLLNLGRSSESRADEASRQTLQDEDTVVIDDNVEYLRAMEGQDQKSHRRSSSRIKQHFKNASISSVPRGLFGGRGRISDTLKRFDGGKSPSADASVQRESYMDMSPETESPGEWQQEDTLELEDDLSPEMRRELERRRLSQEERRVAEAAAAYRQRVSGGGPSGGTRASAIQDRVRSLLDESGRQSPVKRTAVGYGQYTASADETLPAQPSVRAPQPVAAQPVVSKSVPQSLQQGMPVRSRTVAEGPGLAARTLASGGAARPSAPPKPIALRTGGKSTPQLTQDLEHSQDDWEESFARRYPRISLENVEAEIPQGESRQGQPLRVKEI